jgi:hypothetical protein
MGALNKLEAVNRILRFAGEYPVNSLSSSGLNDTLVAERILDETCLQYQIPGKVFNTIIGDRTPDSSGRITIPDTTISVDSTGKDLGRNVTQRGKNPTYLFDIDNNTDVFTGPIRIELVVRTEFEELPTTEQFAVVDSAARIYQMTVVGDVNQDAMIAEMAFMSRAMARAADIRARDWGFTTNFRSYWPQSGARRRFNAD